MSVVYFQGPSGQGDIRVSAANPLPVTGGGGGGGGAVTVADGADVTQGAIADAAYSGTGNGTVVSILKAILARFGIGANSQQVQGAGASGSAAVGNPVGVGGVFLTTLPTLTNGQRSDLMTTVRGALWTSLQSSDGTLLAIVSNNADGVSTTGGTQNRLSVVNTPYLFNGTNYDRQRGDTSGAWVNPGILPTATKRTGTATTTSSQFVAANTARRGLTIQNLSTTATLYVDEFGGTVTAGSGSYTVQPLQSISIQTQNAVTVLSSTGTINLVGTEF